MDGFGKKGTLFGFGSRENENGLQKYEALRTPRMDMKAQNKRVREAQISFKTQKQQVHHHADIPVL